MIAAGGIWSIVVVLLGGLGALGAMLGAIGVGGDKLPAAAVHLCRAAFFLGMAGTCAGLYQASVALSGKAPDMGKLVEVAGMAVSPLALGAAFAGLGAIFSAAGEMRGGA